MSPKLILLLLVALGGAIYLALDALADRVLSADEDEEVWS